MSTRTRAGLVVTVAAVLGLTACGTGRPGTVAELRDALVAAGVPCDHFSEVSPSGRSAGHGSCRQSPDDPYGMGLDVYDDDADRAAEVAAYADLGVGCTVYGPAWSVWVSDPEVQSGTVARLLDRMDDTDTNCPDASR